MASVDGIAGRLSVISIHFADLNERAATDISSIEDEI